MVRKEAVRRRAKAMMDPSCLVVGGPWAKGKEEE
ncbi:hypothetical protein LG52_2776 [Geobacillus kaustophilus]|uniref:Uncharacterized protein n=1 Tax=Geobacillus kaustophilus TaxID=1462 RepID=A0A0D8BWI0_GEOKU|nr:hypothetical protein BJQ97_00506 [Geobacillus sp. TFV-3]KJE28334.1 hypothetical protein LG52_2776 [Geobacillus kaustophilus]